MSNIEFSQIMAQALNAIAHPATNSDTSGCVNEISAGVKIASAPTFREIRRKLMMSRLMAAGIMSFFLLLLGCDKTPSTPEPQQSAENETPEKKAADLIKRAEKGDAQAQGALGRIYFIGEGVPKDTAKAFEWFLKAAEQGDALMQCVVGNMYYSGTEVPKDDAKAFEWFQKAAAQGDAEGQDSLGQAYAKGIGVPKDDAKAVELWQKAAAQGLVNSQTRLGDAYAQGVGVPKDTAKAIEWWQKAAASGDITAHRFLFFAYSRGEGVPKDATKAFEWIQKAAEQGHALDQRILAGLYLTGNGVPKNAVKAFEWLQKAAAQGEEMAQHFLSRAYFLGEGIPKDKVLAYAWANLSATQGDMGAAQIRTLTERGLTPAEIAEAQRLSSTWKKDQILVREGRTTRGSAAQFSTPGKLIKIGTGTLFVVSPAGQAITNHHVVAGCGELRIDGRDGLAKVVTVDAVNDLALVQIPGDAKASAAITSEPGKLRQGEDVAVFGFPLNAVLSSGGNLTPGVVSALTGLGNNTNQIQITAPVQPGSSGSPVLTKKGEVVGVVSMKLSDFEMAKATGSVGQNVNFAVNGQTLRTFLDTNKVAYRSGSGFFSRDKSTADLADEARKWTLVVECWK